MTQLITFGPHKRIEPNNGRMGGTPLMGDILHHNGFDYLCEINPDYDGSQAPTYQLGNNNMWTPVLGELMDVPAIKYDKTKVIPVGWMSDDMVLWRMLDSKEVADE